MLEQKKIWKQSSVTSMFPSIVDEETKVHRDRDLAAGRLTVGDRTRATTPLSLVV